MDIVGLGKAYFALYAPAANISISGNAVIYGAIVGNEVSMNGNGAVHYDKALESITIGTGALTVRSQW